MTKTHLRYRLLVGVLSGLVPLVVVLFSQPDLRRIGDTLSDVLTVESALLGFLIAAVTITVSVCSIDQTPNLNNRIFDLVVAASVTCAKFLLGSTLLNLVTAHLIRDDATPKRLALLGGSIAWLAFTAAISLTFGCLTMTRFLLINSQSTQTPIGEPA